MKKTLVLLLLVSLAIISCNKKIYETNGETIYKTGRNLEGVKMLNRSASRIPFANKCITCHGKNGDKMNSVSIKWSYLSNPKNFSIAYTESLFNRFLDHDLKSDSTKANIGVIWEMSIQDKKDLLEYLTKL